MEEENTAFAVISRSDRVEVLTGAVSVVPRIADLPLPAPGEPGVLAIVPYRQITERGLDAVDDREPLVAMTVATATTVPLDSLPTSAGTPLTGGFDLSDDEYAAAVRRVVTDAIGQGTGSNFVLRRSFRAEVPGWSRRVALGVFRRLAEQERGAYWTFLVHWNGRTLIGATPERQVRYAGGIATMSPISGTYRHPENGPDDRGLLAFLDDRKETEELFMVVDEELKMMARICDRPPRLRGPWLRPMSKVTHTEYAVEGPASRDPRDVLARTLPAPTVTGSPLAAACSVVAEHERGGRGYYGGALAWFGWRDGRRVLDSALLIRTADVRADGTLTLGVGSTLVRRSDPAAEAAETRAKAEALLAAFAPAGVGPAPLPPVAAGVPAALRRRNRGLSRYWRGARRSPPPEPPARRMVLVDAGDDFTAMLAAIAGSLGVDVAVRPAGAPDDALTAGLAPDDPVLIGPGPGDPRDLTVPRIARLHTITRAALTDRRPVLAVCLGHQVLCHTLGLPIRRLPVPAQGLRRRVDWWGDPEWLGFYHTFAAVHGSDRWRCPATGAPVRLLRDARTGAVHALAAPRVRSVQFHVESVLTEHGPAILRRLLRAVTAEAALARCPQTVASGNRGSR
ncbi:anthranilate synthase family protein [Cryptosporangium arvum]|uniref:anthranilate synthase family protein n=1 Tax=Cryptosporangium arvum TaxID=80871 RepID=UPI0004B69899|nr:anthranilate synthase family protein [Cryptosporangium arvum]